MAEETIGKWSNPPEYDYSVAGVLFATPESWIIGQHRDGNTAKSPNLVSFFGGSLEPTDETPLAGALREANEETNRHLKEADVEFFTEYTYQFPDGTIERVFLFVACNQTTDGFEVYEGQGYYVVKTPDDPLISPAVQGAADKWFAQNLDARNR